MGARISKRSGSYNFKKKEEKQERSASKKLQRTYSVISLSEAKIYGDDSNNVIVVSVKDRDDGTVTIRKKDRETVTVKKRDRETVTVKKRDRETVTVKERNNTTVTVKEGGHEIVINKEAEVIKELKNRQQAGLITPSKKVSFVPDDKIAEDIGTPPEVKSKPNDNKEEELLENWGDPFNDEFWKSSDEPVRKECEEQILVRESSEEQIVISNDEQMEVIQEDDESLISDINMVSANVAHNLQNIQKQLEPICKEYLEVQTNQSNDKIIPKINGESNKSDVNAIILSNQDEQIEVPQANTNYNGDSIIDLNLEANDLLAKEKVQILDEIKKNVLTRTTSGNSDISYKSIGNFDVESNVSDTFYDADDYESANINEYDEQLEVCEGELERDKLVSIEIVTSEVIECVNEQTKNTIFEEHDPVESIGSSTDDAQIEVFDEREEESMSSLESMEGFERRNRFETISNLSVESRNSIEVAEENSPSETTERVEMAKFDDDTSREIDIKFQITEKLSRVENEKNEIEIENYLSIERDSENQLDESTAETASVSNEITKVTKENSKNLNLEQTTTVENTNKSITESFSKDTLHESSNIIDSNDILLNNSQVKNVALSETVNFENSEEMELTLSNDFDEEVEIIISQINTVIEEINYLKEQIDSLTSEMHEEHNISEMYLSLIKLMRNVNNIKYSQYNEKIINLQHEALDKIHDCLTKLKSVEAAQKQI